MLVHWKAGKKLFVAFSFFFSMATPWLLRVVVQINTGLQFGTLWFGLTNAVYHIPGDTLFSGLW